MTAPHDERPSSLLDTHEIALLSRALYEWGGPAHASDLLARGMGFADAHTLVQRCAALGTDLKQDTPLEAADWARVLLAVEIVFASDLVGSGTDWRTTTGMDDVETIRLLRTIQRKLGPVVRPYYGATPGRPS
ncbi:MULTISPECIES: hypothetical protein [unclassified Isoptericola]|uniref:hypothetical protein n=1 Tax=unclassified Isoptericola TaxID=2623355 RepID=UPI0036573363